MKIVTKRTTPRVQPDEPVNRRLGVFCERCYSPDAALRRHSEETTLGHQLHYSVCVDEVGCARRVRARQEVRGERPPARVTDLYPS